MVAFSDDVSLVVGSLDIDASDIPTLTVTVSAVVGPRDGVCVGDAVGDDEGANDGNAIGCSEGRTVGTCDGMAVGGLEELEYE